MRPFSWAPAGRQSREASNSSGTARRQQIVAFMMFVFKNGIDRSIQRSERPLGCNTHQNRHSANMKTFKPLLSKMFMAIVVIATARSVLAAEPIERRWVYLQMNLQVPENVDRAGQIMRRAAAAGYNGVVLADYKLNILERVPEFYFDHAEKFKKLAGELKLEIIPVVASMGYSDGILAHDPNLAEGMPVKDAPFTVRSGPS